MVDAVSSAETAFIGLQTLDINNLALRKNVGLANSLRRRSDAPSSIVSTLRSGVAQFMAIKLGLVRSETIVTVALNAGEEVQNRLIQLRNLADRASDANLTDDKRDEIVTEFETLRSELDSIVDNADFDSVNLIDSGADRLTIITNQQGNTLTVEPQDLSASGLGLDEVSVASSSFAAKAVSALDAATDIATARLDALSTVNGKVREEGDQQDKLIRLIEPNVATQIDAEIDEQRAVSLADEVRQNLGVNRLSVANVQSESLLVLIRG
tara:strand:- start:425 stop:1228 length:804 start_codon:yes stop_codon:yes gene_type:complete